MTNLPCVRRCHKQFLVFAPQSKHLNIFSPFFFYSFLVSHLGGGSTRAMARYLASGLAYVKFAYERYFLSCAALFYSDWLAFIRSIYANAALNEIRYRCGSHLLAMRSLLSLLYALLASVRYQSLFRFGFPNTYAVHFAPVVAFAVQLAPIVVVRYYTLSFVIAELMCAFCRTYRKDTLRYAHLRFFR